MSSPRTSILVTHLFLSLYFFFFNDTATTEIYTLSLHDALPILRRPHVLHQDRRVLGQRAQAVAGEQQDRKSTRLNSSHQIISYAVFCLKKKSEPDLQVQHDIKNGEVEWYV